MHCKKQGCTPRCSLYAKTIKKTQCPIFDTLGPFPDETLMSGIDRVLFFLGGKRMQNYFNSERSLEARDKCSCCSAEKRVKRKAHNNRSSDESCVSEKPTYIAIPKGKYFKHQVCSDKSTSFREASVCGYSKESSAKQERGKTSTSLRALKKSFSLCSLACRKIKEKLSLASPPSTTRSVVSPKWLWTKVENYADGCQIYEVFKNSSAACHPTKFDTCKSSKIIFVILPTGIIMPFETLPCH